MILDVRSSHEVLRWCGYLHSSIPRSNEPKHSAVWVFTTVAFPIQHSLDWRSPSAGFKTIRYKLISRILNLVPLTFRIERGITGPRNSLARSDCQQPQAIPVCESAAGVPNLLFPKMGQ